MVSFEVNLPEGNYPVAVLPSGDFEGPSEFITQMVTFDFETFSPGEYYWSFEEALVAFVEFYTYSWLEEPTIPNTPSVKNRIY